MVRQGSGLHSQSRRSFHKRIFHWGIALVLPVASSCGSILYPERRGQPRSGPLDWKVIGLDGIFLVLFVIPGAIAFAVDWWNGTLFLPSNSYGQAGEEGFRKVSLGTPKPSLQQVLAAVKRETQVEIDLHNDPYYAQELQSIEDFTTTREQLLASHQQNSTVFRAQSAESRYQQSESRMPRE